MKKKVISELQELCLVNGCNCHIFYYIKLKDIMGRGVWGGCKSSKCFVIGCFSPICGKRFKVR